MASKKNAHPGCLVGFGLIFLIAGCVPGVIGFKALAFAQATDGWRETTATITSLELRHGGKKGDSLAVEATYRYRAPDVTSLEAGAMSDYTSDQVGVHGGSDNIGSWQQDTFRRLDTARREERPVPAWYDPADPAQAVLDRDPRWPMLGFLMIFPLVFGLVGGGVAWLGIHQWRKRGAAAVDPRIRAGATLITADGGGTVGLWVIAVFWNAIAWAATVAVLHSSDAPLAIRLVVLIFPIVGAMLFGLALLHTTRILHHGRPRLRLEQGTWQSGRRVKATVLVASGPGPGARIDARLAVVRRVESGTGKNRRINEQTLWSCDFPVDPQAGRLAGTGWEQPVELPLPSDLPTNEDDLTWRLEWHVIRPGPDLSATFTLPVAAGDDGAVLLAAEQKVLADRAAPLAVLTRAGIRIAEDRGEVVLSLPGWRNPWLYGPGFVVTVLLTLAAMICAERVGWWTAIVSLPLLLLCWRGVVRSALWRSTITLSVGRIVVSAGWWRQTRHDLQPAEISEVERHSSMSSGDTAYFNMWLKTAEGARIAIARGVPGPAAARLAEMINLART